MRRAAYCARQKRLYFWRSPNASVYQSGVKSLEEAEQIVADTGVRQVLHEVEYIKMPNWQ